MPGIRGITVAVGEPYARTLEICLAKNMRHLVSCLVVTAPGEDSVKAVAAKVPGVEVFETSAFYEHGAAFNKGLAMTRGFEVLGREGQILIHDADILFPDSMPLGNLDPEILYGCRRRILENPANWKPDLNWLACAPSRDGSRPIGFFQLFNASAEALDGVNPWYNVNYPHAGGCDAQFLTYWSMSRTKILNFDVLHIGPTDVNWWGTDAAGREMAAAYFHRMGWRRAMTKHDPAAAKRLGDLVDRVDVPGYETSDFQMPFEKRAQARP